MITRSFLCPGCRVSCSDFARVYAPPSHALRRRRSAHLTPHNGHQALVKHRITDTRQRSRQRASDQSACRLFKGLSYSLFKVHTVSFMVKPCAAVAFIPLLSISANAVQVSSPAVTFCCRASQPSAPALHIFPKIWRYSPRVALLTNSNSGRLHTGCCASLLPALSCPLVPACIRIKNSRISCPEGAAAPTPIRTLHHPGDRSGGQSGFRRG